MAKAADAPTILVVKVAFNGERGETFHVGEAVEADHPYAKKWPEFFGPFVFPHPVRRTVEPRVEAATAAPGEKRGA